MTSESDDIFDAIERDVLAARDETRELAKEWRKWTREIELVLIAQACSAELKSARKEAFQKLAQKLGIKTEEAAAFLTVEGASAEEIAREIDTMFGGADR